MTNKQAAMARAYGLLDALVHFGHIPVFHLDRAKDIIAQYNAPGNDDEWPADVPTAALPEKERAA